MSAFPESSLSRGLAALALAVGLAATVAMPAAAQTELCIEDTAALKQAFASINGQTRQAVTFKLRTGTYQLDSNLEIGYRFPGGSPSADIGKLSLLGGYGPGCTSASTALGATTINGSGGQRLVSIELSNNDLLLEGIASNNIDWTVTNWTCSGGAAGTKVTVDRLHALNTRTWVGHSCFDVLVRNSLFVGRAGADFALAGTSWYPPSRYAVVHTTVRSGPVGLKYPDSHPGVGHVTLSNSVFEHTGIELDIEGANLYLLNNRYDSLNLVRGAIQTNTGNTSAPAQLQASGVPQAGSPLVNTGSQFVPGGLPAIDLARQPRLVGTRPDMGAFETTVNNSVYLDVTNTNSSGAGSLAQAVAALNQNTGPRKIRFNIPGGCPRTITLTQTLTLTEGVDLLGDTQPGTQPSTLTNGYNGVPCIILRAGTGVADGLVFDSPDQADALRLNYLAFSGFTGTAVSMRSSRGHLITGNRFGGSVAGTALLPVGVAIRVEGTATDVQIGGPDPAQTNLIGRAGIGVRLGGPGYNHVLGNAIGEAGFQPLGNEIGVDVLSPGNLIENNWIAQSGTVNVRFNGSQAQFNTLRNNSIFGAAGHGVQIILSAARNRIGPGNHISYNDGDGIYLVSGSRSDLGGNTYVGNGELAIDLAPNGVTPNNADPALDHDGTPNRNQNFPVLAATRRVFHFPFTFLDLQGSMSSTPGIYRIDLYRSNDCDGSGHGEGLKRLGSVDLDVSCAVPLNGQCGRNFQLMLPMSVAVGDIITATATSALGHTSEFSACSTVTQQVVIDPPIFRDGFDPPSLP